MIESRVLSNIPYTIRNRSNYDIALEETRDIVDVPYFPAQNLVDVTGSIDLYQPTLDSYVPFIDQYGNHRLFGLMNRVDARFIFVEFADNARYLQYSFAGVSFPQGRSNYSITYDGNCCYMFGGYANDRCLNDLWCYDIRENRWSNLNYTQVEQGANEAPTRRRKSSVLIKGSTIWVFGGETDVLTVNSLVDDLIVSLNDVWSFDMSTSVWKNYDLNRALPHRTGNVIYTDPSVIKILVNGGMNELGETEPVAIYSIDIATDIVTSEVFTPPFVPSTTNVLLYIDGAVHVFAKPNLYKWDNALSTFTLVKSNISAINPLDKKYWVVQSQSKNFGNNPAMGSRSVAVANLYEFSGALASTKTIGLLPVGVDIPQINLDNQYTFFFGGLINSSLFNNSTYILNHTTLAIDRYDFDPGLCPNERVFPAMGYDKYRGRVYLFGGFDGSKFYNDLWYFDLSLKQWVRVHSQLENDDATDPVYPQPRQKAGMAIVAEQYLYVIGGYSDVHSFNDMWKYDIGLDRWTRMYLADSIPWGSTYKIFEWRDRLFLYNGAQLYRYYEDNKQFASQPLLISTDTGNPMSQATPSADPDDLETIINKKQFLNTPVRTTVVNDYMFVQNSQVHFMVELQTRIVTDLKKEFAIEEWVAWLDRYWGITDDGKSAYFINISPLSPLTKNQIPHSYFHKRIDQALPDGIFYTDITSMNPSQLAYRDNAGSFNMQAAVDPLDKATLLVDGVIGYTALQSDAPTFDFTDTEAWWMETISRVLKPTTYPYAPWFLYSKYKNQSDLTAGAQKVLYNSRTKRIYVIFDNGNVMKINPVDNTFFVYFSKIWKGAAVGYHQMQNKIYAFGGLRNPHEISDTGGTETSSNQVTTTSEQRIYAQTGLECVRNKIVGKQNTRYEVSHCGLLQFDLGLNEMNLGSIQAYLEEKKMQSVDYSITKNYLTSIVRKYMEQYESHAVPSTLEDVQQKLYTATQPLIDDLSQFDYSFENGIRPTARAFMASAQVGNKLYVFGGCESWNNTCKRWQGNEPYWCAKPGSFANTRQGSEIFDPEEEAVWAGYFNMDTQTWVQIADMPEWRYLASAAVSYDETKIYIVGGFLEADCAEPSNDILVYTIASNSYEKLKGVPSSYAARAYPILNWLDERKLMIMYGYRTIGKDAPDPECPGNNYYHIPINDAWVYDTRDNLFYRAFRDLSGFMGIVAKDQFFIDEKVESPYVYILSPTPEYNPKGEVVMKLYQWYLVNGSVTPMDVIPTSEIKNDFSGFSALSKSPHPNEKETPPTTGTSASASTPPQPGVDHGKLNSENIASAAIDSEMVEQETGSPNVDFQTLFVSAYKNSNFRFRYAWIQQYGAYDHKTMFVIGERSDESGISAVADMAAGEEESHLRIWHVDIDAPDQWKFLHNIPYEYPLPVSPVAIAYDGKEYLYCIYNKYNIWRLHFSKMLEDPNGSWWLRLPPCMDCNFLGDSRTDPNWDSFFIPPNYLTLLSKDGRMARMDTKSFVWFLDKKSSPADPITGELPKAGAPAGLTSAAGVDGNEVYMYSLGSISGKVMNVYEKQWDNFFFDMRATSSVVKYFSSILSQKMWPSLIRRKRLYIINHLGHVFYSWIRIDGYYDVEFQLQDFYQGDEIRIYCDYDYLQNWENTSIDVFTITNGWQTINQSYMTPHENEVDWDWDGNYTRQFVRIFLDPFGLPKYQYSKCPPNYLSANLVTSINSMPISKIRVQFKNTPRPYNYMTRISKVELITNQTLLAAYESIDAVQPMDVIFIEPLVITEYSSNAFAVTIRNTNDKVLKDVIAYAYNNDWIQFTATPDIETSWARKTPENPFYVAKSMSEGGDARFYIRGINVSERPQSKDLVIKGVYPYEAT
jgi:N-acetylneuraminic acid mutarotase